jgi:hypothetical protein
MSTAAPDPKPDTPQPPPAPAPAPQDTPPVDPQAAAMPKEIGGPEGPEPTRFGDWEKKGRCSDF